MHALINTFLSLSIHRRETVAPIPCEESLRDKCGLYDLPTGDAANGVLSAWQVLHVEHKGMNS